MEPGEKNSSASLLLDGPTDGEFADEILINDPIR